jgi:hypothetical protein
VVLLTAARPAAGLMQVLFGVLRLGRLIKYMPYPVVSGYLSGVGLIHHLRPGAEVARLARAPTSGPGAGHPSQMGWQAMVVGAVTIFAMVFGAPRLTKARAGRDPGLAGRRRCLLRLSPCSIPDCSIRATAGGRRARQAGGGSFVDTAGRPLERRRPAQQLHELPCW